MLCNTIDVVVSGGLSGVLSEVSVFPIDVLALRMKVSLHRNKTMYRLYRDIVKNGEFRSVRDYC